MDSQIWIGMLDADRSYRYATYMQSKYSRRKSRLEYTTMALFVAVSLPLALMATIELEVAAGVAGAITSVAGAFIAWQARQNLAVKAALSEMAATQFLLLLDDWKRLWRQDNPSEIDVAVLQTRYTCLGTYLGDDTDEKLNREADRQANEQLDAEFRYAYDHGTGAPDTTTTPGPTDTSSVRPG